MISGSGFLYDAEGQMIQLSNGTHKLFDAAGHLVHEWNPGIVGGDRQYAYGAGNRREATFDGAGTTLLTSQTYLSDSPYAFYTPATAQWTYQYQNQVGSEGGRETAGSITKFGSQAFGEGPLTEANGPDTAPYHFAGMNDSVAATPYNGTYLHHAQFRDYYQNLAIWTSPDPYDGSYDFSDPQSLNRYSYARNNPLVYQDPSGRDYRICTPYAPCQYYSDPNWNQVCAGCFNKDVTLEGRNVYCSGVWCATIDYGLGGTNGAPWHSTAQMARSSSDGETQDGAAPNNQRPSAPQPEKKSYWGCVGKTTVEDALWGAGGTAAIAVIAPTVGFAVAGTSVGPEGTFAGAGLGFAIGVAVAPGAAVDSLVLGVPVGLIHGLVGCAFE